MNEDYIIMIKNLTDFGFGTQDAATVTNNLLRVAGIYLKHHERNEKIFDQFLFQGNYADSEIHRIGNLKFNDSSFAQLKSFVGKFTDDEKLKLFSSLLEKDLISQTYYGTQTERYEIKPSNNWHNYSVFKPLSDHKKEEEDLTFTNTQTNSFRP